MFYLAFLPPEATYSFVLADSETANAASDHKTLIHRKYKIVFTERAQWQHSINDLNKLEAYFVRSSRRHQVACLHVQCTADPKFYLLFSHGNAADLGETKIPFFFLFSSNSRNEFSSRFSGQMASFFIVLGSRLRCNIISYDYSGYGASGGSASERNIYADIEAVYQSMKQKFNIPSTKIILYGQSIGKSFKLIQRR